LEEELLKDVVGRLEASGIIYAITGSIASNYWGTPRTTHDVDIVVTMSLAQVRPFLVTLEEKYYVNEVAVRDAVVRREMFNVVDSTTGYKADLWVSSADAFTDSMFARRRRELLFGRLEADIGSPEDVLLQKLVWHTLTHSQRQLADAAGIAAVQAESLDLAYLRHWAAIQGTDELLTDVLAGKYLKRT
jgi:hypothetical protein